MPRRRAAVEGPHDNEERWLLTYADMITLLMVLFVVMYAISNTDVRKFTALAESVSAAFNTDVLQGEQPATIMSGAQTAPDLAQYDAGSGVVATDFRAVQASLKDFAISQGIAAGVSVDKVPEGIAIRISDALLFQSGRARLDDKAIRIVEKIAEVLRPLPNSVRVEGNTDDSPTQGPLYADNWQLSTARALSVVAALQDDGIAPGRLGAAGYGQYKPVVPNTDDVSRARNRRVDVLILYPDATASPAAALP
ncbi:MAG TPA: flagellar motor protein MotB [Candidatus Limnocylindrales bacterium]